MSYKDYGSVAPYYDDYDADKNYLRVLYNPGRAVQARELTQAQTILQNQITKFGSHIFADGSSVLDAKITVDTKKPCIELEALDSGASAVIIDDTWIGQSLVGLTSGATATVDNYDAVERILYINFTGGEFDDAEDVSITGAVQANDIVITATGSKLFGTLAHVSAGIVYINEHFVVITSQTIVVEPKNVSTTHKVGYTIVESVKTISDDTTLNDPANGSFNFNAPGADRYNITLNLNSYESAETPDNDFLSVVEIVNGETTKQQKLVDYSVILDTLARRTFDQSGNYSVDVFNMKVTDHATDADKLSVVVEPGKAYVLGYEVESVSPSTVNIDRSRTSVSKLNAISSTPYGPYTEVDYSVPANINGTFDILAKESIELMSATNGTGDVLGTGRILSIQDINSKLRLYLSGLDKYESIFSSVRSIRSTGTPANFMNIELYGDNNLPILSNKNSKPILFDTQNDYIAAIVASSTTYEVTRNGTIIISGGSAVINAGVNERFASNPVMYLTAVGGVFEPSAGYSAVISGASSEFLTITDTGGLPDASYDITYRITKQNANGKTKTLTQGTMSLVSTDVNGEIDLTHVDVYDIISVIEDPAGAATDVTANAVLDSGQNDYFYDFGKMSGLTASATHTINYLYFAHGGVGDYFTVDSYTTPAANSSTTNPRTGLPYDDFYGYIPEYTSTLGVSYSLRDTFDFRRSVSEGNVDLVIPEDTITTDYSYYIPRIDKVYVDPYGNFGTITGVPELIADHPKEPEGAMVIGTLYLSPYTSFPDEVNIELKDTRRYTMEDIGEIERRLENVEYYTAMNLLEINAKDFRITDKNGFDKFKNGILVDKFTGHDVGDVYNIDYRCSVDPVKEELRPSFLVDNVDFVNDAGNSSNISIHDNIITKSYTTSPFISQLLASETINVNPYNVFVWEGTVKLSPSVDNWVDTTTLPDLLVNEDDSNANWLAARNEAAAFGTQWGWWRTNWVGVSRRTFTNVQRSGWLNITSRTTITNTRRGQDRFGTRMVVRPKTTRKNLGDRVINTTIIPWIRTRNISYDAKRMKPSTTVLAYFDGIDVSANCTNLTTDVNGSMVGTFTIPANKFRTGERILRFADDGTSNPTTSAEGNYTASGLRQFKRRTIISMTKPELVRQTVSQSRIVSSLAWASNVVRVQQTDWTDPIAESFLIDEEGGVFLSDIDIWFKTKPSSGVPITLRIVENDNGYPSQVIVPYSEVTLNPSAVTVTGNETAPTTATKFTFSDPVYLQDAVEYSFMLISNSNEYEVYIGKIGDNKIGTTNRIDKQPYAGVMFKSQNSSTWTADQERDIMFEINRCVFDTGTPSIYALELDTASFNSPALVTTNMFNIDNIALEATELSMTYQYLSDSTPVSFENKEDVDLPLLQTLTSGGGATQLKVVNTMTTTKDNLTPVISVDSASSVVISTELSAGTVVSPNNGLSYKVGGTYITRSTNLANPSDDLKVLVDMNKPSGTDVAVYFKTGKYEPRYVPVTGGEEQTSFDEEIVYFYYDTTASNVVSLETNAVVSQVDVTNNRYYLKSIVDSSKLVDPAGLGGQTIFACLIDDITFLESWNVGTAYTVGQHVWEAGLLYENVANNTGTTPGTNSAIWLLVPSTNITNALVVDAEQTWREMAAETVESADEFDFVETTFKPKEAIIDEFSSFSIKIELLTNSEIAYPLCKAFRSIAVY